MPKAKPKRIEAHFYFEPDLWRWLKDQAAANGRKIQGEVTWRLKQQRQTELNERAFGP